MAYSTQKGFIHVAFMNERPEPTCLFTEAVALKKYASTFDERAWMLNDFQQSRYIADLVACRMYTRGGDDGGSGQPSTGNPSRINSTTDVSRKCGSCAETQCNDDLQSIGRDSIIGATIDVMRNIESMCLDT